MITLNDYLYEGDTVLSIILDYAKDLKQSSAIDHNLIDLVHSDFLMQLYGLLTENGFLTSQSRRLQDFYEYMAAAYPYLAFTFKGRIKSLIRSEEKFNGYIVSYIYNYYLKHHDYPSVSELEDQLTIFRDLIAYRLVISLPRRHADGEEDRKEKEMRLLYKLANKLPSYLEDRGFTPELSGFRNEKESPYMDNEVKAYYRDYIQNPQGLGYRSLHITLYDNISRSYIEFQIRTKEMDDYAEIGQANHSQYEKQQEQERTRREAIPLGENIYFDEAFERVRMLQSLDLSKLDVNLFGAVNNSLINDGCGLYRGRLILPYEHLSSFQKIK